MVSKKSLYTELFNILTNQRQLTNKGTRIIKELIGTNPTTSNSTTGDTSTNNNSSNAISRRHDNGKNTIKSHKSAKAKTTNQKDIANHLLKEIGMKSDKPKDTKRNYHSNNSLHVQLHSRNTNQLSPKNNPYLNGRKLD